MATFTGCFDGVLEMVSHRETTTDHCVLVFYQQFVRVWKSHIEIWKCFNDPSKQDDPCNKYRIAKVAWHRSRVCRAIDFEWIRLKDLNGPKICLGRPLLNLSRRLGHHQRDRVRLPRQRIEKCQSIVAFIDLNLKISSTLTMAQVTQMSFERSAIPSSESESSWVLVVRFWTDLSNWFLERCRDAEMER